MTSRARLLKSFELSSCTKVLIYLATNPELLLQAPTEMKSITTKYSNSFNIKTTFQEAGFNTTSELNRKERILKRNLASPWNNEDN